MFVLNWVNTLPGMSGWFGAEAAMRHLMKTMRSQGKAADGFTLTVLELVIGRSTTATGLGAVANKKNPYSQSITRLLI